MRERPCPICGGDAASRLFAESNYDASQLDAYAYASRKTPDYMHLRLWECGTCDLVYANPVPGTDELARAYDGAAFDSQQQAVLAARTYAEQVRRILPQLPDRESALDIGTGEGAFLNELLDLGFRDVHGVEPSAAPIAAADPRVRSRIRHGIFEPGLFEPGTLTLITCFQTIEHVLTPGDLCREAYRLLKPGGALCLVGHNRRAWSARLLGRRSPIFDIEHMQLFSPAGFHALLAGAEFTKPYVRPVWNRYPLGYWAQLFPLPKPIKRVVASTLTRSRLGNLQCSLPAGNLVAVGFRPR